MGCDAVVLADQVLRKLLAHSHPIEALLLLEPFEVTAVFPVGEVVFGQPLADGTEFGNDLQVGESVGHQLIDAVTSFFGQMCDFTFARNGLPGLWHPRWTALRVGLGFGDRSLVSWW